MTFEEYQAIDAVNFSSLKHFERSALHYKTYKDNPKPPTDAMEFGNILHKVVWESDIYLPRLVTGPTLTRGTKKWLEAQLDTPDAILVTENEKERLTGMAHSILRNETAMGYIRGGATEVTLQATCSETGLKLKGRLDLMAKDGKTILDLKSCRDARPKAFENDISKYCYFRQAAFYVRLAQLAGHTHRNFLFLAVESQMPYACALHALEPCSMGLGLDANLSNLRDLKTCLELDCWPSYSEEVQICSVKPWAMPDEEEA